MDNNIIKELNDIEINDYKVKKRILKLLKIINMNIDYRKQIDKIEALIGDR